MQENCWLLKLKEKKNEIQWTVNLNPQLCEVEKREENSGRCSNRPRAWCQMSNQRCDFSWEFLIGKLEADFSLFLTRSPPPLFVSGIATRDTHMCALLRLFFPLFVCRGSLNFSCQQHKKIMRQMSNKNFKNNYTRKRLSGGEKSKSKPSRDEMWDENLHFIAVVRILER